MSTARKFVFICGLHRSGTSILHEALRGHREISGFENTGAPEDEGQHLQSVFLPAMAFGGPGKFGFKPDAAMTESHELVTETNRQKLFQEWSRYWDPKKPLLLEKSPPNIIRTRFLQAMFPGSYFIVLTRHPIAVSYATQKWSKTGLSQLLDHWLTVHTIFEHDRPHLTNVCMLSYEQLIHSATETFGRISQYLGIPLIRTSALSDHNQAYFRKWLSPSPWNYILRSRIVNRYESRIQQFGYSLRDTSGYPVFA